MSTEDRADPIAVSTPLLLAASLLMENTSAELVPSVEPTAEQLIEKIQLMRDTVDQLQALSRAARAAMRQHSR